MAGPRENDEARLATEASAGDRVALAELVRRHQGRLFNVVFRMLGNHEDAADVTQESLVQVVQRIDTYRGDAQLSTWMTRVAINQAITFLRKAKRRPTVSIDAAPRNGRADHDASDVGFSASLEQHREPSPVQSVQLEEDRQQLQQALASLDENFRAVLVLRDIEQLDYQQIGSVLDIPEGTVKSRLFRARLMLRDKLRKHHEP